MVDFHLPEFNLAPEKIASRVVTSKPSQLRVLGREIAELRSQLVFIQDLGNAAKKRLSEVHAEKRETSLEWEKKLEDLRNQMNEVLLSFNAKLGEVQTELNTHNNNYFNKQRELEEKQKLYAKLLESRNEAERLSELAQTVMELVGEWPAFQKARNYQKDVIFSAVQLYKDGKNGLLNADDMGLGKTFETIVSMKVIELLFEKDHNRKPSILWLTKKSLVQTTPVEIRKWWDDRQVLKMTDIGKVSLREFAVETALGMGAILLTNYEAVRTTPLLANTTWDILVVDEVHKLKGGANSSGPTAIWKAVKELAFKATFMFFLSGTPMVNSPVEMWSYLHIFNPEKFPTMKQFRRDYCEKAKVAGEFNLVVNPDKLLQGALKGQMVRRRMDEVDIEMPDFNIEERVLEMGEAQRKVYDEMRTKFFIWVDEQEGKTISAAAVIAQLNYLRQISVHPGMLHQVDAVTGDELSLQTSDSIKIDESVDLVEDFADQCIIGCTFNEPLFELQRRLIKKGLRAEVLTGANSNMAGEFERRFQNKELDVFLMNIKMGAGMNLHKSPEDWRGGARYGITLDRWWSPADNDQFYKRIWRPGATHGVVIYDLFCEKSVDFFIADLLERKTKEINSIAESSDVRPASEWKNFLEELV